MINFYFVSVLLCNKNLKGYKRIYMIAIHKQNQHDRVLYNICFFVDISTFV